MYLSFSLERWPQINQSACGVCAIIPQQIANPGRINAEHQGHRRILEALKGDVVTGTDFHVVSP
jgi:hypothetical protein